MSALRANRVVPEISASSQKRPFPECAALANCGQPLGLADGQLFGPRFGKSGAQRDLELGHQNSSISMRLKLYIIELTCDRAK